jgi:uncharacterized protein (TIGR01777 family)
MKIVVAGGTGFLGRPLTAALAQDGHEIVVLTRGSTSSPQADRPRAPVAPTRSVAWSPTGGIGPWAAEIDGAGAVVNLAGESIAGKRWTAAQKQRILDSRVHATRSIASAIRGAADPPPVFVSGSAVGYYGPLGEDAATEETPAGSDFLALVCEQWERGDASRERSHARDPHPHGHRPSRRMVARCRRCCHRSDSARAGRSDRDASTGRGFTATTGSDSCAGDCHAGGGRRAQRDWRRGL